MQSSKNAEGMTGLLPVKMASLGKKFVRWWMIL
jgi:hypothetical protein